MPAVIVRNRKAYFEVGRSGPGSGKTVLLVHGAGGNSGRWAEQITFLGKSHYVLALDLPGHGRSEGEAFDTVPSYADWLHEAAVTLGLQRFALGGHSMGGAIALDFALRYPASLDGLILVSTGARLRVDPARLDAYRRGEYREEWTRLSFSPKAPEQLIAQAIEDARRTDPAVRYRDFLACDAFDVIDRVGSVNVPTLVICGQDDVATPPKFARYLAEKIPGAKLCLVEDAGHMVMVEKPEVVNLEIGHFLERLGR